LVGTLPPDPDPPPGRRYRRIGLTDYLREVLAESRKVATPDLRELATYSGVTLVCAASATAFVVVIDGLFSRGLLRALL
jgi:preprotein translocase SecE subunit